MGMEMLKKKNALPGNSWRETARERVTLSETGSDWKNPEKEETERHSKGRGSGRKSV